VMQTVRAEHLFLRDAPAPLVESSGEITWWTFAGGAANLLLARILEAALGEKVVSRNTSITLKHQAGQSLAAVRSVLGLLARQSGPTTEDAVRHAQGAGARARISKFDPCLPEDQFARLAVEGVLDVEGAQKAVRAADAPVDRDEDEFDCSPPPPIKPGLVAKLRQLLPALEGPGPHGELVTPGNAQHGATLAPYWTRAAHLDALERVLYDHDVVYAFDWKRWLRGPEGRRLFESADAIDSADLLCLRRLATAHVRQDRFSEGHLVRAAESRQLAALARRLTAVLKHAPGGDSTHTGTG
jgi:hypothetical protein